MNVNSADTEKKGRVVKTSEMTQDIGVFIYLPFGIMLVYISCISIHAL